MSRNDLIKERMVRWLAPPQLLRTGIEVLVSDLFGRHADKRLFLPGVTSLSANYYVYTHQGFTPVLLFKPQDVVTTPTVDQDAEEADELWLNYIADVGDGFDSTYSMAHCVTRPQINFNVDLEEDPKGEYQTKFEDILIFGGDEVYPRATTEDYENRLTKPYELAFKANELKKDHSTVFAIPGNHDWYDSLVLFSEKFCERRRFAEQRTVQDRSYFALKLIKGWWVFATDTQLGNSLDKPQKDYFTEVMKHFGKTDRIIFCNSTPYWTGGGLDENKLKRIKDLKEKKEDASKQEAKKLCDEVLNNASQEFRGLEFFLGHNLKNQVEVMLSGDLHHYCHYELEIDDLNKRPSSIKHKITAGGGGAFMHPTQIGNPELIGTLNGNKFRKKISFPDEKKSQDLFVANFKNIVTNWSFGIVTAAFYLLLAYVCQFDIRGVGFLEIFFKILNGLADTPVALTLIVIVFFGVIFFAEAKTLSGRILFGFVHALTHLASFFFIFWYVQSSVGNIEFSYRICRILSLAIPIAACGWIFGSIIMAAYLFTAIWVVKTHGNMAYSAVAIEDYKNFLRLKIDKDGKLTIYPIGLEKVCKKWTWVEDGKKRLYMPDEEIRMKLIEKPIEIVKGFVS